MNGALRPDGSPALLSAAVGKLNGIGDKMAAKLAQAGEVLAGLELALPPGGITTGRAALGMTGKRRAGAPLLLGRAASRESTKWTGGGGMAVASCFAWSLLAFTAR